MRYYSPSTTKETCAYLGISEEAMFEARVESGQRYLTDKYGEDTKAQLQRERAFWSWYLRIWEIIDKRFLNAATGARRKYRWKDYVWFHYYNGLTYEMDSKVLSNLLSNHKIRQS